jgi:GTP 3',8-cyclase
MTECTDQIYPELKDGYNRVIKNVRISVTDRCNLRCEYCMPEEGIKWKKPEEIMSYEEITRLVKILHQSGVHKFRFTGGEPTVRSDFITLVQMIQRICPLLDLSITTNGLKLVELAEDLYSAGIKRLNISLDTLDHQKFLKITKRDQFQKVLDGIKEAQKYPFQEIKLNAVAIKNFNDNEIMDFVTFSEQTGITVRFIELMPFTGNNWNLGEYISKHEILSILQAEDLKPIQQKIKSQTSTEYTLRHGKAKIGFIASVSESFCETCDRIRLTSEGNIRTCLHSNHEIPIREHLHLSDADIYDILQKGVSEKWAGHPDFTKVHYKPPVDDRAMILIGG